MLDRWWRGNKLGLCAHTHTGMNGCKEYSKPLRVINDEEQNTYQDGNNSFKSFFER